MQSKGADRLDWFRSVFLIRNLCFETKLSEQKSRSRCKNSSQQKSLDKIEKQVISTLPLAFYNRSFETILENIKNLIIC